MNNNKFFNNNEDNYVKDLNTSSIDIHPKNLENDIQFKVNLQSNDLSLNKSRQFNNNLVNKDFNLDRNRQSGNNFNLYKDNSYLKNTNYHNLSNQQNSAIQKINSVRQKNAYGNSIATNKVASAGLGAAGVPKPLADKVVNSEMGQKAINQAKKRLPALNLFNKLTGGNDSYETPSGEGGVNFQLSMKFMKIAAIFSIPVLVVIVFCCLFMSASQVYSKSIGLGNADNVGLPEAEDKIKDAKDDKLNEETTDEESRQVGFVGNVSKFMSSKLMHANLVLDNSSSVIVKERNFNEADLSKLEDYYSQAIDYSKQYDMDIVYTFYFKLYYIQRYYQNKYHVNLDMPLIMATLNMQSSDMGDIFASNIKDYDVNLKSENPYFAYDYDWTSYVTSKEVSIHDIEVLAQNMVTETTEDKCSNPIMKTDENGNQQRVCYVIDDKKYKEFLKEFLEKKYYLKDTPLTGSSTGNTNNGDNNSSNNNSNNNINSNSNSNNFADSMINLALSQKGISGRPNKYTRWYGAIGGSFSYEWCATFVSWVVANTNYNGVNFNSIINYKSASTVNWANYFKKNGIYKPAKYYGGDYTPKKGDIILFAWGGLDNHRICHIGIVTNCDGQKVYTIEGNTSDMVNIRSYKINSKDIVGYGVWYE